MLLGLWQRLWLAANLMAEPNRQCIRVTIQYAAIQLISLLDLSRRTSANRLSAGGTFMPISLIANGATHTLGRTCLFEKMECANAGYVCAPAGVRIMSDIVWGDEIKVDGKRPAWLKDGEQFQAGGGGFEWFGIVSTGKPYIWNAQPIREPSWDGVGHIRLPANHPHYTQQTPTPDVVGIAPELVERMVACLRAAADVPKDSVFGRSGYASEARAIVSLLPEPVDGLERLINIAMNSGDTAKEIAETIRSSPDV